MMIGGPLTLMVLGGWLAIYLQPTFLMSVIQSRFNPDEVLFFIPPSSLPHAGGGFLRRGRSKKAGLPPIALTIDDSPTKNTGAILDELKVGLVMMLYTLITLRW